MKLCPKCNKQFSDDANFCPVDAARLGPVLATTPDDSLGARFELGDKLGGSRTGAVHRAKDKQTGQQVAVKLISPAVTALSGVAQRLERELKQLERVQSAGVTKLLASGKRGDDTWIALELLDGAQTLAEAITARGPIALDQAAHLIEVVGEALIEAAQVGVVHRDLAPKNVLFAGHDVKLINFSLPVPTSDRIPGVPEFVAPEQIDGKPVDQRSNLYSLGALYYYVLTGQTVHSGTPDEIHRAHTGATIRTPSSLAPVPGPVEAVIMRALDRSPTKRFLTVRQFVDEVGRIARGEVDPRHAVPAGKAKPKAELVQTLLGVRSGAAIAPPISAPASAPAPAPIAQPVAQPAVAVRPPVVAQPMAAPVHMASTVAGVPAGAGLPALDAPPMAAAVAVAAPLAAPTGGGDRSPWAPPKTDSAKTAPAKVATAAAAPVPAAPVVAAPVVAAKKQAAPAGKKKADEVRGKGTKGKFRETMWFKKGDLDAQAAQQAAEERAATGKDATGDQADSLPIDERYKDDGTITRGDKEKYSLRTGATQMMSALNDGDRRAGHSTKISEDALIGEMKGGRQVILLAIGGAVIVIVLLIWLLT